MRIRPELPAPGYHIRGPYEDVGSQPFEVTSAKIAEIDQIGG